VKAKFNPWVTIEQLSTDLEQARVNLTDSITVRQQLVQLVEKRDIELADACAARDALDRKLTQARIELAQAQEQLSNPVQRCGYCSYKATGADAFKVVAEHIKSCPEHPLAGALAELAQARTKIGQLFDYDKWLCGQTETKRQAAIARNARLAALVTPELAALLDRLAQYANLYDAPESAYNARALAARIREALEMNNGD